MITFCSVTRAWANGKSVLSGWWQELVASQIFYTKSTPHVCLSGMINHCLTGPRYYSCRGAILPNLLSENTVWGSVQNFSSAIQINKACEVTQLHRNESSNYSRWVWHARLPQFAELFLRLDGYLKENEVLFLFFPILEKQIAKLFLNTRACTPTPSPYRLKKSILVKSAYFSCVCTASTSFSNVS